MSNHQNFNTRSSRTNMRKYNLDSIFETFKSVEYQKNPNKKAKFNSVDLKIEEITQKKSLQRRGKTLNSFLQKLKTTSKEVLSSQNSGNTYSTLKKELNTKNSQTKFSPSEVKKNLINF